MKTANAVIIGGGIVGTAIAAYLSEELDKVVLIEKEEIAAQASGCNYGMVWIQPRTPGFEFKIASHSQELYEKLINEEFDIDIEYEKVGGLTVGFTKSQFKAMQWFCKKKADAGIPVKMIESREVLKMEPNLNPDICGAIYCEDDAQLNPYLTVMAFANLARKRGAEIITGESVDRINVENGRVVSVDTSIGEIQTDRVILCAGYASGKIGRTAGIDVPVFPQRLQSLVTEPVAPLLTRIVQGARPLDEKDAEEHPEYALEFDFAEAGSSEEDLPSLEVEDTIFAFLKPTVSGTVVLGTTNEFVGEDRRTTPRGMAAIMKEVVKICPALENTKIIRTWAGLIPYTFDSKPILGKVTDIRGLYMATGHPHAFSHAPALAESMTELIMDEKNMSELSKYIFDTAGINRFETKN